MIPTLLQDDLVEETKLMFDGFMLKNAKKETVPMNVYPQFLPSKSSKEDINHFPYIIVRTSDGEEKNEGDVPDTKIMFIVGVFDEDDKYQGYKDVMNALEKMYQHLFRKRVISNKYECIFPVKWVVNEEDVYPYYFGGLETNWTLPKIMQDDLEGLI